MYWVAQGDWKESSR